ncbi:MAG: methyltransferase [Lachnospiraceae bacterium]|nr:methyltransferase [Lachnospiraceae bacterium]
MTKRENAMAIYRGEIPEYYGDLMDSIKLIPDPLLVRNMIPKDGKEHQDIWGTSFVFLPDAPGAHPHVTAENAVIKDIEHWEEQLQIPDYSGFDFTQAREEAEKIDRSEYLVGFMLSGGLFERSHHLMGMTEALINYLEYPDEMKGLLRVIADKKMEYIRMVARECKPDIIFYHDDWGAKKSLFLPPAVWRDIIKPLQKEIADTIHECGMIYMHHSDCFCQPLAPDMLDIGIDIWQGVIPQNDIVEIQKVTEGKLAMVGGVDGPMLDVEGISEEAIRQEVRRAIDTYCPAGRFYPTIANSRCFRQWNNQIYRDELEKYGHEFAQRQRAEAGL